MVRGPYTAALLLAVLVSALQPRQARAAETFIVSSPQVITTAPGNTTSFDVTIHNGAVPANVAFGATDIIEVLNGGVSAGGSRVREGGWLSSENAPLSLAAYSTITVTVTLRVPANAPDGDHYAALCARDKAVTTSGGGIEFAVHYQMCSILHIQLPATAGSAVPQLVVVGKSSLRYYFGTYAAAFGSVSNTGRAISAGQQHISARITSPDGSTTTVTRKLGPIAPGFTAPIEVLVGQAGILPPPGSTVSFSLS
jgi:hypothetical protein